MKGFRDQVEKYGAAARELSFGVRRCGEVVQEQHR